jgi:thiosulfate/3-mercaptopyruvate sulfurtransferase
MNRFIVRNQIPTKCLILDARTETQYLSSHLPGARHAEFVTPKFIIRDQSGLELFHHALETWVQSIGLEIGDAVVVYDSGLDARASRTAWALEYAGFEVSILNGGFQAWEAACQPVSDETITVDASRFKLELQPELLATADDILQRSSTTIVLDARDALEFSGQKIPVGATRGGHIPGAQHFEWTRVMDTQGFLSSSQLEQILAGFPRDSELIVHCQSGARSAVLYHALKSQGFRVRNYLGSMNEWLNQNDLAIE